MSNKHLPVKIIECPRDAMQGFHTFIPTESKIQYINQLLKVGFDTIDFGSFVSSKAIPQMADSSVVVDSLEDPFNSKLLAIIANERGAEEATNKQQIQYLGFPLSLSETFQVRNTNKSIEEAFQTVETIQNLCISKKKEQVVYLSMGFGNPYGDPYSTDFVKAFVKRLYNLGIRIISLSDTIGVADTKVLTELFSVLIPTYPDVEFGAHLHSHPATVQEKIEAAYQAGCRRFDSAINGYGGCPMAKDELVGNLATELLIGYFQKRQIPTNINMEELRKAMELASSVFPTE